MGRLRVMSKNGDDETVWNDPATAAIAESMFNDLLAKGHTAFAKTPDGHEHIKTFDRDAEEILVIRPLVGG